MKHVYLYILSAVLPLGFLSSCVKDKPTDQEILDSRPVTDLSVSYTVGGAEITALRFGHLAGTKTIDVAVNDPNLVWNLVSNRDWCQVVSPSGKGPGQAVLKVSANDGFDQRENATLTFVAGDYRGFQLNVSQSASAFSLSQPYFLSGPDGDDFEIAVTTRSDLAWDFVSDDFLTVTAEEVVVKEDLSTTTLRVQVNGNTAASRMGKISLTGGEEPEAVYIYQFGSEYSFDAEGRMLLPASGASVSVVLPDFALEGVVLPEKMATYEVSAPQDGFVTLTISLKENLSDTSEKREVSASLLLSDVSASVVNLPVLYQDYLSANGLVTAKGLKFFAAAVAAGEPTTEWETDGVVCVKGDIDMDGVTDWKGIGTEKHPFAGSFNGGGHAIQNLVAANGLFNYCSNATIKDITIGKGSVLLQKVNDTAAGYFGGIVSVAESTTLTGCTLAGAVEFACNNTLSYVGGIVGYADNASVVRGARMTGSVKVSTPSGQSSICYLGGIAGLSEGTLAESEVLGTVSFSSGIGTVYAGGLEGALVEGATVQANHFMGTLSLSGSAGMAAVGGLYGVIESDRAFEKDSDSSVSLGNIQLDGFRAATTCCVYAGGFVGLVAEGVILGLKGYDLQTNVTLDCKSKALNAKYVCIGGFIGGCKEKEPLKMLTCENLKSAGVIRGLYATSVACTVRRNWMGGIAGYVCGPANFISCTNEGEVGKHEGDEYCAKSNGHGEICGGIAGYVNGGDASFTDCKNRANISEHLYNNNASTGVFENMYTPPVVGGILGAFNYGTSPEPYQLTITSCVNTRNIFGYRGYNGGIVGYCWNATITGCSNTGRLSNGANDQSAFRGGIAGGAGNTTISGCQANCDVYAMVYGSAEFGDAGGILGMARGTDPVAITDCKFFGSVKSSKANTDKPEYPGGIVGQGTDATTISNCSYGGSVQGVEITANNVDTPEIVIGNAIGTVSGISYWGGK